MYKTVHQCPLKPRNLGFIAVSGRYVDLHKMLCFGLFLNLVIRAFSPTNCGVANMVNVFKYLTQ